MSLLYFDGFDLRDPTIRWVTAQGVGTTTTTPWGVGSAMSLSGNNSGAATARHGFTASAHLFCGFAWRANGVTSGTIVRLMGDGATVTHLQLSWTSTGVLQLHRGAGTTLLASSASGLVAASTYYYIEIEATVDDTVGICNVRLNGNVVISFTGDTRNAGTAASLDTIFYTNPLTTSTSTFIDDVYVCNNVTSADPTRPNNTFLGPWVRVQTLQPNGAGSSTQFTPTSGANYTTVNDTPDTTTSYNADAVSGHRDLFTMDDLVAGSSVVFGVHQVMHARQLDAGAALIKHAQKSGATISYGANHSLSAVVDVYEDTFETNPATGLAWTEAEVDALEAGYEVV